MMHIQKVAIISAVVMCCSVPARIVTAQHVDAARPDQGAPPQPSEAGRASGTPKTTSEPTETDLARIAALLADRCLACHGVDKKEGEYSVASFSSLRAAGDSSKTPVVAGKPEASELYRRLVTEDPSERMPAEAEPLTAEQLAMISAWIASGAKIPLELERRPLGQWPHPHDRSDVPEHYPTPLPIAAVALTPDGQTLWTSGYGEIMQWSVGDGKLLKRLRVAGRRVADIDISRDGRYLAVSSGTPGTQGVVEVWSLTAEPFSSALWTDASSDIARDIAFAPQGDRLAIGMSDGSLRLVELGQLAEKPQASTSTFTPHADAILCVAWSDAGDRLITGSRDRTAKIFDAHTIDLIANYDRHQRAVGGVAYAGTRPVSFDESGQLRLWAGDDSDRTLAETGNLPRFLEPLVSSDQHIYLSDGGDVRVLTVEQKTVEDGKDDAGKPKTKKVDQWREEQRLDSDARSWIMSLSANANLLAAGTESGEVLVWDKNARALKLKFNARP